jgi:hypothetical protein
VSPPAPSGGARTDAPVAGIGTQMPNGKTWERLAVDALVTGSYAEAARRYGQLAQEHPDRPVFGEAARILAAKADSGAR